MLLQFFMHKEAEILRLGCTFPRRNRWKAIACAKQIFAAMSEKADWDIFEMALKVTNYSYFVHKKEYILFINHSRKSIFTQPKSI